jgi:copper chaperone CopZ
VKALQLRIDGMSCGHCVARVEKALKEIDGVSIGKVQIGYAELFYDPSKVTVAALRAVLEEAGYAAHAVEPSAVLA